MRYRVIITSWGVRRVFMRGGHAALFRTAAAGEAAVAAHFGYRPWDRKPVPVGRFVAEACAV